MSKYLLYYLIFAAIAVTHVNCADNEGIVSAPPSTLQEQLDALSAKSKTRTPPEVKAIMQQAAMELAEKNIPQTSLQEGETIPQIVLPDASNNPVSVQETLKDGPVVITFYRGGWCPYCNLSLRALQQALPQIKELGATLIAISPEQPDSSLDTKTRNELEFHVLSDQGNTVAQAFGIVFSLPEPLQGVYKEFGIDLEKSNGDSSGQLPVAATFVADTDGTIVYAFVDTDYKKRAEPADIIAILESLQD